MNVEELKAVQDKNLPHLQWSEVFDAKGELTDDNKKVMEEYFAKFVKSEGCPNCGAKFGHLIWGLAHGEAYCSTENCGWPYRGAHYDVGPITSLKLSLPYHPDGLSF